MRRLALLIFSVPAVVAAGTEVSFPPPSSCALCHSRIPAPADANAASIAQVGLWGGSMMAHSSRDPFWRAKVRDEAALTPSAAAVIEDKCLRCHAPTQQYPLRIAGRMMSLRDLGSAGEGVACAVCHQISKAGLGAPGSFSGAFQINTDAEAYGPHPDPFRMPMQHMAGLTPTESSHILEASLCGTCHTVITPTLTADGQVRGELLEQAPYLEWLASGYPKSGITCATCHVPALRDASGAPGVQYLAHNPMGRWFPPTGPRSPFGLHFFAGANAAMLNLLAISEPANAAALRRTAGKAHDNLRSAVALAAKATIDRGVLQVTVDLRNRTGHKLPTGFPSRRIWLHVAVVSESGRTLFESGGWNSTGLLRSGALEPHRSVIARPEQTMIYQAAPADVAGRRTVSLLRAGSYAKDNRILPAGFDPARDPRLAPAGVSNDPGFRPGSHQVRYEIPIVRGSRPAEVKVEAVYQSIDPAWLSQGDADAIRPALAPIMMNSVTVSPNPGN